MKKQTNNLPTSVSRVGFSPWLLRAFLCEREMARERDMGMGQNCTRNWTAGFRPFHLPGLAHLWVPLLTCPMGQVAGAEAAGAAGEPPGGLQVPRGPGPEIGVAVSARFSFRAGDNEV